jgi:hypothetical protein
MTETADSLTARISRPLLHAISACITPSAYFVTMISRNTITILNMCMYIYEYIYIHVLGICKFVIPSSLCMHLLIYLRLI